MAKDNLDLADMLSVMRGCRIVEQQPAGKYRVEGRTGDGAPVVAICQLQETTRSGKRVFTVWRIIKR
jgi:lipopolysaccharide export system protein LptA